MPDSFKLLNESFSEVGSPPETHGGFQDFDALSRIESQLPIATPVPENTHPMRAPENQTPRGEEAEALRPSTVPEVTADSRREPQSKAAFIGKSPPEKTLKMNVDEAAPTSPVDEKWRQTHLKQLLASLRASPPSVSNAQRRLHGVFRR